MYEIDNTADNTFLERKERAFRWRYMNMRLKAFK